MRGQDDQFVCAECFDDVGICAFIDRLASCEVCSFCGRTGETEIAAPLDEVVGHIESSIRRRYDDPANAGLPYESAEGGYQGTTYSTEELLIDVVGLDLPRDQSGLLLEAIVSAIGNELWSDADPFGMTPELRLSFSWSEFCRYIKYERRYFFMSAQRTDRELFPPEEVLGLIFDYAQDAGMFVTLLAGTEVWRVRYERRKGEFTTVSDLGAPPAASAKANRMSPAGIVMFYASEQLETALAETADKGGIYVAARFKILRDITVLDLTNLPDIPSIFEEIPDSLHYDPRPRSLFLREIADDISKPIERDDRVHIDYVPTQVVTEYLRTVTVIDGKTVQGVRYCSSRVNNGTSLVLFASKDNEILSESECKPWFYQEEDRWLALSETKELHMAATQLHKLLKAVGQMDKGDN